MGCSSAALFFIYLLNKIIRIACALSLVNSCVWMRVCKHSCNITLILIGFVLSDLHFDWLVGNMIVYEENLFHSRSKKTAFSFICQSIFEKYFIKALGLFFSVFTKPHLSTQHLNKLEAQSRVA